jgi:hypothetical protein
VRSLKSMTKGLVYDKPWSKCFRMSSKISTLNFLLGVRSPLTYSLRAGTRASASSS